ncbi:uncharacterized protein LOC133530311 isoform X1 [Cydia pomonella]|uniref:uncharacterized protein LOC133530311 isoform X1 n=1 Tax=Cydia pomonella TaxID=82600 RepID=UPI002ADD9355|nr:uncharacterized protein LOC133530311 isoform X1 [Cydia pomonella]
MKWLVLSCFLLWARHGEGGALKCLPEDDACSSQLSQQVEQQEMDIRRPTSSDAPAECLSGSEWDSNCHSCRCVAGEAQCVRQSGCHSIEEPIRCKPNTTFERDCNTCRCLENGLGICTIMECASVTTEAAPSKPIIPKGVDCAPGTTWQSQCNECVCSPEGRRYCTDKACPGQETEPLLRCAPQSQWKNDCNMCWCNSGRAMCTKMGCMGIPSEMHFDDRKGAETVEIPEPNELPEVPVLTSNDILESDAKDQKHISENLEDLDTTTDPDEDLTGVNLKDLEDFDNNDLDTPIQIPDQVMSDFAANNNTNVFDEDLDILEALLSHGTKEKLEEQTSDRSKIKEVEISEEEKAASDNLRAHKDVEILDDSYINQSQDHRVKRSACKPNEEFLDDCNTCKCSESGQSYSCTQNECMDKDGKEGGKDVDKEVEVFMENEGVDHIERHSVCKPSTTFYVGCNPCHCNSDGTDFSCTNKPCPLPEDVEVFHELHEMKPIVPLKGEDTKNINKPTK